jgi:outer membrane protein OmpA-like peptidoglycan-associated protein
VILATVLVSSGCATRKYVRQQVQTLEPAIQEAQNATKENAERIDAVDRRAQQGITAATTAANTADQKAVAAQKSADTAQQAAQAADRKADTANQGIQQANNRINTVEGRLSTLDVYTESDKQTVTFSNNSSTLNDEAKATLDKIASDLSSARNGFMIELQGYTDGTGSELYNIGLSQRRADAVLRYLVSKNIPLFRIAIVGLGEENPVADNKTRDGRAQNRRVEVRVLRTAGSRQTN